MVGDPENLTNNKLNAFKRWRKVSTLRTHKCQFQTHSNKCPLGLKGEWVNRDVFQDNSLRPRRICYKDNNLISFWRYLPKAMPEWQQALLLLIDSGFKYRPGNTLPRLRLFVFFEPFQANTHDNNKLGHGRFLPYPLQFVTYQQSKFMLINLSCRQHPPQINKYL